MFEKLLTNEMFKISISCRNDALRHYDTEEKEERSYEYICRRSFLNFMEDRIDAATVSINGLYYAVNHEYDLRLFYALEKEYRRGYIYQSDWDNDIRSLMSRLDLDDAEEGIEEVFVCLKITDRFAFFDECDNEDRILGYRIIREYHDGYIKMSFLVEKFILDVFLRNSRYVYAYKIVHKTYERWCVIEKYDAEHDDYYEIVVDEWGNDYPTRTPEEFDEIYAFCDRICHGGHSYLCKEETMENGMKKYHVMCRHGLKYTNVCVTTNYEEVREYFERCWKEI